MKTCAVFCKLCTQNQLLLFTNGSVVPLLQPACCYFARYNLSESFFFLFPVINSSVSKGQFLFPKARVSPRRALPRNWRRWSPACWSLSRTLPTGGSWPPPKPCLASARKRQKGRKSSMVRKTRPPGAQLGLVSNTCLSCPLFRAVCNRARSRAHAERPPGHLLQAVGEGAAPDHLRAVHHFPQPGRNHRNAL